MKKLEPFDWIAPLIVWGVLASMAAWILDMSLWMAIGVALVALLGNALMISFEDKVEDERIEKERRKNSN